MPLGFRLIRPVRGQYERYAKALFILLRHYAHALRETGTPGLRLQVDHEHAEAASSSTPSLILLAVSAVACRGWLLRCSTCMRPLASCVHWKGRGYN